MDLSSFLRSAALEKSADIIKKNNLLVLSDRDRDLFLAALEATPEPNENLKRAFAEYKKQ